MKKSLYLICVPLILIGCKAATVTSTDAKYSEDLSQYRKALTGNTPDTSITTPVVEEGGTLEGHIAMELDSVLSMIADRNAANDSWDGYTIQVYSGLSREEAYAARDKAEELALDLLPTIEYYQPNYRVKGGKFFDRLAAYRMYKEVKEAFPQALLLPTKLSLSANDGDQ